MNSLTDFILANQSESVRTAFQTIADRLMQPAVLVGGAIRDALFNRPISDLDIVVHGAKQEALADTFKEFLKSKTDFGGLRLEVNGIPVDMWPLHETWAFKTMWVMDPQFRDYPRTTFFNLESIAVSCDGPFAVYEGGFIEAMRSKTLEVNYEPNPFPRLCVVRAAVMCKRFNMTVGPKLAKFIVEHKAPTPTLMGVQKHKYKQEVVTAEEMTEFVEEAERIAVSNA